MNSGSGSINVENRLKNSSSFWKNIYTSDFIMDVIESSYKIPFINEPENIILKNNKSALVKKNKKPVDIKFSAHDACRE